MYTTKHTDIISIVQSIIPCSTEANIQVLNMEPNTGR